MTAQRDLQDRLNACLDRLQSGATVEECLALYAQDAAELEPLLDRLWGAGNYSVDAVGESRDRLGLSARSSAAHTAADLLERL